ncbi:tRNA uridine-5-carboxymethylaminomethyl(34) synthesis enzyme MnmG [Prosthecochloris vibrioformis]|uniref:tRNA uridine 5-carboxymethylaminomethyl modification enzyme MnmG n=1 Tax=Prosthecochloris vibrioformis TaxID=1098 RepID=A0A5C4S3D9_PROVB|nr:tRNA uridine-5-carboxymethylaminomethyl(34) synthesis enzyme MnmG [Prosthecochloris vibrioformis]TNJ37649.1 tRNA uridine-5-carboxymethylaminomethyl(34) synthesis enzyme MnmG [Prosthecochloris vibrioformis]
MYDIIVAGAGHAGCEAALAAARLGHNTLLITTDLSAIARMSCNPAIGGVAKGQIAREIDALGGEMGKAIDATGIQFRMLNSSKGPAMHSPRAQADKSAYTAYMRKVIEKEPNLYLLQDAVTGVQVNEGSCTGAIVMSGRSIPCKALILACGTFLNGIIHIGLKHYPGGRTLAEPPVSGLTEQLVSMGFEAGRLKTGTPARIDARSVDYTKVTPQPGDTPPSPFSYNTTDLGERKQLNCYLTATTEETHRILEKGFDRSPLFTGKVQGTGPRYCPSIEDKIFRFKDKKSHHIFLEPEGYDTNEMYVNGLSTSLPEDIQIEAIHSIPGLENTIIIRPGYAIEYDYFYPSQIFSTMETKLVENLYFTGQINGTSGYEEAAAQGLLAGINASRKLQGKSKFTLGRSEAYIGVLIDDLITKETREPYRMFTSAAEHRIILRQDNADRRLLRHGNAVGLQNSAMLSYLEHKEEAITTIRSLLEQIRIRADQPELLQLFSRYGYSKPEGAQRCINLLKRPHISLNDILATSQDAFDRISAVSMEPDILKQVEIDCKYEGYIKREHLVAEKISRLEHHEIPKTFTYENVIGLSSEGKEKLQRHKPETIGQASRIMGVTPADISILMVKLGR